MKKFSNRYMILYSLALVAVASIVLSVTAVALKPRQEKNKVAEQQQMVLKSIGVEASRSEAGELYNKYISEHVCAQTGQSDGHDSYYTYNINGREGIILPLHGTGLWGPIWGYIALDEERYIIGAVFDHKGETPGLGGEIASAKFAEQFVGKRVVDDKGSVKPIKLKKNADKKSLYEVDAISGGTMTSNGVSEMFDKDLKSFEEIVKQ
ncbi:MAG: FMN-binding protein [Bacteroidales bacterium]|nr:FMN-binding protein [Bacteroidales bacterium]